MFNNKKIKELEEFTEERFKNVWERLTKIQEEFVECDICGCLLRKSNCLSVSNNHSFNGLYLYNATSDKYYCKLHIPKCLKEKK